jgi:hypothetical protein
LSENEAPLIGGRNVYGIFVGTFERNKLLWRYRRRGEDDVRIGYSEIWQNDVDWSHET